MTATLQWGVIFDMDGVLLDSERIIRDELRDSAEQRGFPIAWELYLQLIGRNARDVETLLIERLGSGFPWSEIRAVAKQRVEQRVTRGWPLKAHVVETLEQLAYHDIPCAVATSTGGEEAHRRLDSAGIRNYFSALCSGDEVERGKPHPDLFLLAADRLSKAAECCIVIEDSPYGLQASRAAGMRGIWIPDLVHPTGKEDPQWIVMKSMAELAPWILGQGAKR